MSTSATSGPQLPDPVVELLARASIEVQIDGRRADVVLAAPHRRNVQTPTTWRALAALAPLLAELADVVVLRALGPSFSAGLDLAAVQAAAAATASNRTPDEASAQEVDPAEQLDPGLVELFGADDGGRRNLIAEFQRGFTLWRELPVPTVAVVQGHAVGAGFQLALACDLRIAAPQASFSMRETQLGLVPDLAGTAPLLDAVGYARAVEICLTGRTLDAAEALSLGIVQQVADPLGPAVDVLVAQLLTPPSQAVRATKALLAGPLAEHVRRQVALEAQAQSPLLTAMLSRLTASGA